MYFSPELKTTQVRDVTLIKVLLQPTLPKNIFPPPLGALYLQTRSLVLLFQNSRSPEEPRPTQMPSSSTLIDEIVHTDLCFSHCNCIIRGWPFSQPNNHKAGGVTFQHKF